MYRTGIADKVLFLTQGPDTFVLTLHLESALGLITT